jgi:hypothetical protein
MKQWQERLPTLNLILICLILLIIFIAAFIMGPVNQVSIRNDAIITKLHERFEIESCVDFESFYIDKEMYVTNCKIKENNYYFFLDKNGILYKQLLVNQDKELLDYSIIIEKYNLTRSEFSIVYYQDQVAYLVKSEEFEYVIGYENYDVLMKVRF